jgi:hypothetical protein
MECVMAKNCAKNGKTERRPSSVLAMLLRTFRRDVFDHYRPELHYMRGPGPKWHAKHEVAATDEAALGDAAVTA